MDIKPKIKKMLAAGIAALLLTAAVSAAEPMPAAGGYVALGDSIAYGYGLSDKNESYPSLVAAGLGTEVANYAVNGMTSGGLLTALKNMEQDGAGLARLKNAFLITVSIGSNDLLSKLSGAWVMLSDDAASYAALEAMLTSDDSMASFASGVEAYRANLPEIYEALREINPTARIVMTEFYNPYYGVKLGEFDFGALADSFIVQMNDILHRGQERMDYAVAPVYEAFNAPALTKVDMAALNPDPHPNSDGHHIFAEAVLSVSGSTALPAGAPVPAETEAAAGTVNEEAETPGTETEETAAETEGTGSDPGKNNYYYYIIISAVAVAAFAVTGYAVSKQNRKM